MLNKNQFLDEYADNFGKPLAYSATQLYDFYKSEYKNIKNEYQKLQNGRETLHIATINLSEIDDMVLPLRQLEAENGIERTPQQTKEVLGVTYIVIQEIKKTL